jgi:regulation of enolase protein 1 (concanavalin A-like superfamily)
LAYFYKEQTMTEILNLTDTTLSKSFFWFNEAPTHHFDDGLHLRTQGNTDFWQRTHYGFRRDDGHCLFTRATGDFQFSCRAVFAPESQYDQCGLMVRSDENHWIKQSTEYENPTISRLGSVVTNLGYSDWATQDVSSAIGERWYRMTREDNDFTLEWSADGVQWDQMRITHLHDAQDTISVGLYACSPKGEGFNCSFHNFRLTPVAN